MQTKKVDETWKRRIEEALKKFIQITSNNFFY